MKRAEHILNNTITAEGEYTITVKGIRKADKAVYGDSIGNKVIIDGALNTGKIERIFLNADKVGNQTESFYDSAIFALADQLDKLPVSDDDFDTDDLAMMNTVFAGKTFTCWCVHNTSTDGKVYANLYFKKTNEVVMMLNLQ